MTIALPLSVPDIQDICLRLEALETLEDSGMQISDAAGLRWRRAPRDARVAELTADIHGLDADQKHALVALMWIGRGDFAVQDWDEALREAEQRHEGPTAEYLLSHPLAGAEILDGLDAVQQGDSAYA